MDDIETHGGRVKSSMIDTGLDLWRREGVAAVSARRIGKELGVTHAAVLYHFGSAEAMKHALANEAVRLGDTDIIPQLITMKHPAVADMASTDRQGFLAGC